MIKLARLVTIEAVAHRCSSKKVFLNISQISEENTIFDKVTGLRDCKFIIDSSTGSENARILHIQNTIVKDEL